MIYLSAHFALIAITSFAWNVQGLDYCYLTDDDPYRYYGSITAYGEILNSTDASIPGCTVKRFWLLARHGTRYPGSDDLDLMSVLPNIRQDSDLETALSNGTMCQEDVDALGDWEQKFTNDQHLKLAPEGYREMRDLAERYLRSLPELGNITYNETTHEFRHTYTSSERTRDSALAFAEGLLGFTDGVVLTEVPEDEDWLLYYYNLCEKHQQEVREKPLVEFEAFKEGEEMESVMRYIEDRLQLPDGYINYANLSAIVYSCIFEYGVYRSDNMSEIAPWCSLIPEHIAQILEYQEDLRYYWRDGYGVEINYEQACIVTDDIIAHFTEEDMPVIATRFAHSANLNNLYARLGLFHDDVSPTADNYEDQLDRKFRMSHIGTMASNIAFVLYDCNDTEEGDIVKVFVNEQPVILPGCESAECAWDTVYDYWKQTIGTCDMEAICAVDTSGAANVNTAILLLTVFFVFIKLV